MNKENKKLNIWWKLALVSAIINIVTFPGWVLLRFGGILFGDLYEEYGHYSIIFLCWFLVIPLVYFSVFCLWHWRTRYAGKYHIVWPIFTVVTYWPGGLTTLPGSFFVAIIYFFMHILPDIRRKGAYANPPKLVIDPPATPLPKKYTLLKTACFATGWSLIIIGLHAAILSCIAHFFIWGVFASRIPHLVGDPFTYKISKGLLLAVDVSKICVVSSLLCAITTAIGAIFIQISQRIRWRLLEEEEKKELRKSFNKENSE